MNHTSGRCQPPPPPPTHTAAYECLVLRTAPKVAAQKNYEEMYSEQIRIAETPCPLPPPRPHLGSLLLSLFSSFDREGDFLLLLPSFLSPHIPPPPPLRSNDHGTRRRRRRRQRDQFYGVHHQRGRGMLRGKTGNKVSGGFLDSFWSLNLLLGKIINKSPSSSSVLSPPRPFSISPPFSLRPEFRAEGWKVE